MNFCKYGIGWETSIAELQEIGERRINMMRLFNQKLGFSRKDDTLPKKAFLPVELEDGEVAQITPEQFEHTLTTYYEYAGWDAETGNPTQETIERLGLGWVREKLCL